MFTVVFWLDQMDNSDHWVRAYDSEALAIAAAFAAVDADLCDRAEVCNSKLLPLRPIITRAQTGCKQSSATH